MALIPNTKVWDPTGPEMRAFLEARRRRERWYKPGVWMARALRRRFIEARVDVRHAYQRVVRGWDDSAVWSLDDHLGETLGAQLVEMADIAHAYPGEHYPFEQWTADLRSHGEALLTYQREHYEGADHGAEWDSIYAPAQDALRWVADNLGSLWD